MGVIDGTGKLPPATSPLTTSTAGGVVVQKVATPGPPGPPGKNAFSFTSAAFTMPPADDTTTVNVKVTDSSWMGLGQPLFVSAAGEMKVSSIVDAKNVLLVNPGGTGNAAPATGIPAPAKVSPGGGTSAGGGGGLVPITYQPGGTAAPNVFIDQASLATAMAAAKGATTVFLDLNFNGGGPQFLAGNVDFGEFLVGLAYFDTTGSTTVIPNITSNGWSLLTPPEVITDVHFNITTGSDLMPEPGRLLLNGATALSVGPGAGNFAYTVAGISELVMDDASALGIGFNDPIIHVTATGQLSIDLRNHAQIFNPFAILVDPGGSCSVTVHSHDCYIAPSFSVQPGISFTYGAANVDPGPLTFQPAGTRNGRTFITESEFVTASNQFFGPSTTYLDFSLTAGVWDTSEPWYLGSFVQGVVPPGTGIPPQLNTHVYIYPNFQEMRDLTLNIGGGNGFLIEPVTFRMSGSSTLESSDGTFLYSVTVNNASIQLYDEGILGDAVHPVIHVTATGILYVQLYGTSSVRPNAFTIDAGGQVVFQRFSSAISVDPTYKGQVGVSFQDFTVSRPGFPPGAAHTGTAVYSASTFANSAILLDDNGKSFGFELGKCYTLTIKTLITSNLVGGAGPAVFIDELVVQGAASGISFITLQSTTSILSKPGSSGWSVSYALSSGVGAADLHIAANRNAGGGAPLNAISVVSWIQNVNNSISGGP